MRRNCFRRKGISGVLFINARNSMAFYLGAINISLGSKYYKTIYISKALPNCLPTQIKGYQHSLLDNSWPKSSYLCEILRKHSNGFTVYVCNIRSFHKLIAHHSIIYQRSSFPLKFVMVEHGKYFYYGNHSTSFIFLDTDAKQIEKFLCDEGGDGKCALVH